MKKSYLILIFYLPLQLLYSQEGVSFKESKQLYLQGNSILIGNNILGEHATKPLMNLTIPNDLVDMKYIDVDDDKSTFSSSEATIVNASENSKIKYAALYWCGLYPYKKGILRESGNNMIHVGRGDRDNDVNSILFKTPNGNYETVNGEIVYDSYNSEAFKTNKPYVCYADITSRIQSLPDINGTYTSANIKATEGKISGGGSAGWLLYIVYEDESQSPKYFNIYDGMIEVNKDVVDVSFMDFKSKDEGDVHTTIAIGAMEGDRRLKTDQVSVFNKATGDFIPLSNKVRDKRNFFNSSITIGDEFFNDRNPNSANTLGFDLLKMEIPNKNNELFDSTTTETNFQFHGKADRFYLFFVAFETEINNTFLEEKTGIINEIAIADSSEKSQESTREAVLHKDALAIGKEIETVKQKKPEETIKISISEEGIVQQIKAISVEKEIDPVKKSAPEVQQTIKINIPEEQLVISEEEDIKKEADVRTMSVPGLNPGYYIVTNVFSLESNAVNWLKTLEEKNYQPRTFINPENKWNYVYIANEKSLKPIYEKWKANKDLPLFKEIWIVEINM